MAIVNNQHVLDFYQKTLKLIQKSRIPFLIGGTFAFTHYTNIKRPTKDIDVFCKSGDYLRILELFRRNGFKTEISDSRWLAKIFQGKYFVDLIFGSVNGIAPVDDSWFEKAPSASILNTKTLLIPPEEMIWSKIYRHNKNHYDGHDVTHLILKTGKEINWKRLLNRMEPHWLLLFSSILLFIFVYPANANIIPRWLIDELMERFKHQINLPLPKELISRGPLLSRSEYKIDITKWGYQTIT